MMSLTPVLGSTQKRIANFHYWRAQAAVLDKFTMALGMAALTGVFAQLVVPLPGTPVPVTGQTLIVLLTGVLLGGRWGALSQGLYVGLGALGLPWLAGSAGGTAAAFGATGGYLLGFVLAAFFVGRLLDARPDLRSFFPLIGVLWFASFVLIQAPGLGVLALWFKLTTGSVPAFGELINLGFLPFVPGDVIKLLLAASLAKALRPA